MTTISVTLPAKLLRCLDELVADGVGRNRADTMRFALERLIEEAVIIEMLREELEKPGRNGLSEFFDLD
jgi:Arc/MetJ-type ribon-helix-helix transcriptional regulator